MNECQGTTKTQLGVNSQTFGTEQQGSCRKIREIKQKEFERLTSTDMDVNNAYKLKKTRNLERNQYRNINRSSGTRLEQMEN